MRQFARVLVPSYRRFVCGKLCALVDKGFVSHLFVGVLGGVEALILLSLLLDLNVRHGCGRLSKPFRDVLVGR
jgi:hypothetical protein